MAYEVRKDYRINSQVEREGVCGREAIAIAPGATDLPRYVRALWLNAEGDVTGIPVGQKSDTPVTFSAVSAGFFPMGFRRITAAPSGTLGII